jgi:hypothetical protein
MAALTATNPTLLDVCNRMEPDGSIANVAEILDSKNEVMRVLPFVEANLPTGHQSVVRAGIPTASFRKYYGFVSPVKSETVKITDAAAMIEQYSVVDKALADLNGNSNAFRTSEDRPIIKGMSDWFVYNLIYGNDKTTPEGILGLAPRYNDLTTAASKANIIDGGGSSGLTSIWVCNFGDDSGFAFYPKGSKAGLQMNAGQEATTLQSSSGYMEAYKTHYKWDVGFCVKDWRHFVRIPNIAVGSLTKDAATGADLIDLLTQAVELVEDLGPNAAILCNRRIRGFLRRQTVNKVVESTLTMETVAGKRVMFFDEIPVLRVDGILNTETRVV